MCLMSLILKPCLKNRHNEIQGATTQCPEIRWLLRHHGPPRRIAMLLLSAPQDRRLQAEAHHMAGAPGVSTRLGRDRIEGSVHPFDRHMSPWRCFPMVACTNGSVFRRDGCKASKDIKSIHSTRALPSEPPFSP